MTDPFSPEGPAIPGKVEKTKKGRRGGLKRTTWQEEEGGGHLVKDHEDKLAGKEGSLGKTWQLCEQPDAHTLFHSLLHVLALKEVGNATGHHNAMDWGQAGRLETYCPREILSHFWGKYFVPGEWTFCDKMSMGRKFLSHF